MTAIPLWLRFVRAGVLRAVHRNAVVGVIPRPVPTRVPCAPSWVIGIVAWRGSVLPLLRPGNEATTLDPLFTDVRAAIVAQTGRSLVAIAADAVLDWTAEPDNTSVLDPSEVLARGRTLTSILPPRP